jgi:hypothetical protein
MKIDIATLKDGDMIEVFFDAIFDYVQKAENKEQALEKLSALNNELDIIRMDIHKVIFEISQDEINSECFLTTVQHYLNSTKPGSGG